MQETLHWKILAERTARRDIDTLDVGEHSPVEAVRGDASGFFDFDVIFESRQDAPAGRPACVLMPLEELRRLESMEPLVGIDGIHRVSPSQWLVVPEPVDAGPLQMKLRVSYPGRLEDEELERLLARFSEAPAWGTGAARAHQVPESQAEPHATGRQFFHAMDLLMSASEYELRSDEQRKDLAAALALGLYEEPDRLAETLLTHGADGMQALRTVLETARAHRRRFAFQKPPERPAPRDEERLVLFGQIIARLACAHFGRGALETEMAAERPPHEKPEPQPRPRPLGWAFMRFASGELRRRYGPYESTFQQVHVEGDGISLDERRWLDIEEHYKQARPDRAVLNPRSTFNIEPDGDLYECFAEFAAILATSEVDGFKGTFEQQVWQYLFPVIVASLELFYDRYAARPLGGVTVQSLSPFTRVMVAKGRCGESSPNNVFLTELIQRYRRDVYQGSFYLMWQNTTAFGRRHITHSQDRSRYEPFGAPPSPF